MFDHDKFDKQFDSMWRFHLVGMVAGGLVSLAVLGFVGWVVVRLLMFWGVV